MSSRFEVRNSVPSHQTIQRIYSLDELYSIERTPPSIQIIAEDNKTIVTPLPEKVEKVDSTQEKLKTEKSKNSFDRPKGKGQTARLKRGKVVRFSDLPPLPNSNFDEILTERNHRSPSQIKVTIQ